MITRFAPLPGKLDVQKEIRDMDRAVKKITASKASPRRFLAKLGIYDKNGQIKPQYR